MTISEETTRKALSSPKALAILLIKLPSSSKRDLWSWSPAAGPKDTSPKVLKYSVIKYFYLPGGTADLASAYSHTIWTNVHSHSTVKKHWALNTLQKVWLMPMVKSISLRGKRIGFTSGNSTMVLFCKICMIKWMTLDSNQAGVLRTVPLTKCSTWLMALINYFK